MRGETSGDLGLGIIIIIFIITNTNIISAGTCWDLDLGRGERGGMLAQTETSPGYHGQEDQDQDHEEHGDQEHHNDPEDDDGGH